MTSLRWTSLALLFAAGLLFAATSNASSAQGEAGNTQRILSETSGMDFSALSPSAQKELAQVLTDEFCYCGCPHSIGQCLKSHSSCPHARRAARLAAAAAQAQVPSQEIIVELSTYYQSFRESRRPVKIDPGMCQGPKNAAVTVVEYSDFECPYCGAARPALEEFAKSHASQVRLCYAPFPLSAHPNAIPAGQAALFARDHGKFWAMHDLLFENQTELNRGFIQRLAARVGLDAGALSKAISEKKYVDELNAFKESGRAAGVESTPAIYFNGRKFGLPVNGESLSQSLEDELEWIGHHSAWAAD